MNWNNKQEEELKNRIGELFFSQFDHATIIGKIDFCVTQKQKATTKQQAQNIVSLLWAEAKRGVVSDIYKPLMQLILTIGKARTFDNYLPPPFLAAFDAEKIAFLPYKEILPFFSLNDFNWNVAPSDDTTREFGLLYDAVKTTIDRSAYIFRYDAHEKELREFIRVHLSANSELIQINKNNFVSIYQRWLAQVQSSIDVDWDTLKKRGIIDGDFFLADLLSDNNQSIKEALYVLLKDNRYVVDRKIDASGMFNESTVFFKDQQKAHAQFWSIYQRPPKEEYWDYIINRRDLLVPQDVRERKGSFFTPKIWVDLSQKYLANVLGENWQDEYYVWDCAAGTGNLLNGLTNKYRIWASTLDQQDVDVMKDRIRNGANLLESHVFQFDFLNDEFTKLPQPLQDIINDEEKRKKLVIYINPPYAEAGNKKAVAKTGHNKTDVAVLNTTYQNYFPSIRIAGRELFAQFMARIYREIPNCILAQFSKLKMICAPNFEGFRTYFKAKLTRCFIVPSATFDNVKGEFPIGFFIWDTKEVEKFTLTIADVYNAQGNYSGQKKLVCEENYLSINDWIIKTRHRQNEMSIGYMVAKAADFQNNSYNYIVNSKEQLPDPRGTLITDKNLTEIAIYYGVRHCIKATWLNDRDLFHCPNKGWETDLEFQSNCLTFTLFSNNIQSQYGTNHWIPFTEAEVNAKEEFESHFITDYIAGKLETQQTETDGLLAQEQQSFIPTEPLVFSLETTAVFDAGRELWRYYHAQPNANPNASYYDIRAHFQGRNEKGKMNPKSEDKEYMRLLGNLKEAMEVLRLKIVPKVYEYGFLIE
ncbi:MAG: hypothetical protein ACTTKZ_03905 [Bacteroides sp.]